MFTLKGVVANTFMHIYGLLPLKNKVVFSCFDGKTYGDNPKAIYEKMIEEFDDKLEYIWMMRDEKMVIPGAKVVRSYSLKALYHLATAKIWIDNSRKREWTYKRKKQYYIQTWHGGLTTKKVEKDAEDKLPESYIRSAKHDSKIADLFISGSEWNTNNYRESFWYDGEILECGLPRSDIFFKENINDIRNKVYEYYGIEKESKLILYSPTFRADGNTDCYDIDYLRLLREAEAKWGGKWRVLIRLHPNIQTAQGLINYNDRILNGSSYSSINEQIMAAEVIVTDYSSCMFDAMEIGKRVFIYASDRTAYFSDRGTYFDLENLPFPFTENNDDLMYAIRMFDDRSYEDSIKAFIMNYRIYDNGTACQQINERIRSVIKL